jgi:hypothetical protein
MMDPLLIYLAITTTATIILDLLLISYYRRFWLTIKAIGLDAAPSAAKRTDEMMTGGQAWKKLR